MRILLFFGIFSALAFAQTPRRPAGPKPDFFGIGPAPDPAAVERGQKLYVAQCGFCHGSSGKGGSGGPDLIRSVIVMHDEGTTKEVGPVIREGRVSKGMPKFSMTDAQIKDIAAFLQSLIRATIIRGEYKIGNLATGDAKAGLAFFTANCASCHSATGDLSKAGAKYDQPNLLARFLYPRVRNTEKGKLTATVTLPSGQPVSGELAWIDDFSVGITDSSGQLQSWTLGGAGGVKAAVNDPLEGHELLLKKYTDADMHNILSYLVTLK
jgi:mono/diheme cytochrome c family protein